MFERTLIRSVWSVKLTFLASFTGDDPNTAYSRRVASTSNVGGKTRFNLGLNVESSAPLDLLLRLEHFHYREDRLAHSENTVNSAPVEVANLMRS